MSFTVLFSLSDAGFFHSGYLGLTLGFSENFTCWSFRWFQMSTAESCSAKFYKGKKLITAEMKLHGWFYTNPVITASVGYI